MVDELFYDEEMLAFMPQFPIFWDEWCESGYFASRGEDREYYESFDDVRQLAL